MKIKIISDSRTVRISIPFWLLFNRLGRYISQSILNSQTFDASLSRSDVVRIFNVIKQVRHTHPGTFIEIKSADGDEVLIEL